MSSVACALLSASSMWSSGHGEEAQPSVSLPPVNVSNPPARSKERPKAKKAPPAKRVAAPQPPAPVAPPPALSPQSPFGPGVGYSATRSAAGSKTDTPIMESPQSISVITRQQMDDRAVQNLNDALRYTAGVQVGDTGDLTTESFTIRGNNTPYLALYRDGLRSMFRAFDSVTEPYGLDRIEVIKGPTSVLYGQGSPGGMVNLVTKRPTENPFGEVEAQFGSFKRRQVGIDFGGPASNDKDNTVLYRLTALLRDSNTQIDYVPDDRVYVAPAFTFRSPTRDTTLTVLANYQKDHTSFPDGLPAAGTVLFNPNGKIPVNRFTGEPAWSKFDRTSKSIAYILDHNVTNDFSVHQVARYTDAEYDRNQIQDQGLVSPDGREIARRARQSFQTSKLLAVDTRAQYKFEVASVRHNVIAGVDYLNARFSTELWQSAPGGVPNLDVFTPQYGAAITTPLAWFDDRQKGFQTGLYLQDQVKVWDRLNIVAGLRHDYASETVDNRLESVTTKQTDKATTYRVGAIYDLPFGLAPYVSYAQSFTPILGDTDAAGRQFKPETGEQYEVGVKYQPLSAFIMTLSAFRLIRQNVLTPDPDPNNSGFSVQTGEITTRGIEAEAVGNITESISLVANYTHLENEVTKSNDADLGKRPVAVANQLASLWAKYAFKYGPLEGVSFGAGVRYVGNSAGDFTNEFFVPSHTLVDMTIRYETKKVRVALNANNIFDKQYISTCFSNASCYFGIRRTVTGSVAYKW